MIIRGQYGNDTFTVAEAEAIQYAIAAWEQTIQNDITINLQLWKVQFPENRPLNAMCIPGIFQNSETTLTRPQAKLTPGFIQDQEALDIIVLISGATTWDTTTGSGTTVGEDQFSLSTTILREICHGLGFISFCNVTPAENPALGIFTDTNLIKKAINIMEACVPQVPVSENLFPGNLQDSIFTPFANLFHTNNGQVKMQTANEVQNYTAFTTENAIQLIYDMKGSNYTVYTENGSFSPFTSCDYITGKYLMNPSTEGQYYDAPDDSSKNVLAALGWNIPSAPVTIQKIRQEEQE